MTEPRTLLCTYARNGHVCGMVREEESVHVWPNERMQPGWHVWRHIERDAHRLDRTIEAAQPAEAVALLRALVDAEDAFREFPSRNLTEAIDEALAAARRYLDGR